MTGFFIFSAASRLLPADSDGWKNFVSHATGLSAAAGKNLELHGPADPALAKSGT